MTTYKRGHDMYKKIRLGDILETTSQEYFEQLWHVFMNRGPLFYAKGSANLDYETSIIEIADLCGLDMAVRYFQETGYRCNELTLFAVTCARTVQHLFPQCEKMLDLVERYLNGLASLEELKSGYKTLKITKRSNKWALRMTKELGVGIGELNMNLLLWSIYTASGSQKDLQISSFKELFGH